MILSMGFKYRSPEAKVESCLNYMHKLQSASIKDQGKIDKLLVDSSKSIACEFIDLSLIEKKDNGFLIIASYMKKKWQMDQNKKMIRINED